MARGTPWQNLFLQPHGGSCTCVGFLMLECVLAFASCCAGLCLVKRSWAESCVVVDGEATERSLCLRGSDQSSAEQHAHRVIESVGALPSRHWTRAESSRMTDSSLTTLERFACRIAATWGSPARATRAHDHSALSCMWLKRLGWSLPSSWPSWCSRDAETRGLVRTLEVWREMPRISWKEGHSRGPAMRGWLQGRSQMGWNLP